MKRTVVYLVLAAAALLVFFSSCGDSSDTFTGSVVLKDFTSNSAHTLHLAVFDRGGSDSFIYLSDPTSTLRSYTTTYTGTGPEDVVVADILIENPDFDVSSGLNLFLMIASDEDDSGDLTPGTDRVLPFYSFVLHNGEALELEGIRFDTALADVGTYSASPNSHHVWLNISDLLPFTVDSENKVILYIHDGVNDFSAGPYYRQIVIEDRKLLGDMMLYYFIGNIYYFLLHYDTNGNGTIDSGDHVSYSTINAVDAGYATDLSGGSGELTLELNSYTVVP